LQPGISIRALVTDGSMKYWGSNTYGQIGDGTNVTQVVPTPMSLVELQSP
jgi:hypothetical protein